MPREFENLWALCAAEANRQRDEEERRQRNLDFVNQESKKYHAVPRNKRPDANLSTVVRLGEKDAVEAKLETLLGSVVPQLNEWVSAFLEMHDKTRKPIDLWGEAETRIEGLAEQLGRVPESLVRDLGKEMFLAFADDEASAREYWAILEKL
jgi:hypothetical protein